MPTSGQFRPALALYMQTHTHTNGPWHYAPGELIYGPNGESVASCRFVTNFKEINVANMRLVAAAPDLLAALQAVLSTYRTFRNVPQDLQEWTCIDDEAFEQGLSAIAKAKGGA